MCRSALVKRRTERLTGLCGTNFQYRISLFPAPLPRFRPCLPPHTPHKGRNDAPSDCPHHCSVLRASLLCPARVGLATRVGQWVAVAEAASRHRSIYKSAPDVRFSTLTLAPHQLTGRYPSSCGSHWIMIWHMEAPADVKMFESFIALFIFQLISCTS